MTKKEPKSDAPALAFLALGSCPWSFLDPQVLCQCINTEQRFPTLHPPHLYLDVIDIQHCVILRCKQCCLIFDAHQNAQVSCKKY